ncbi:germination-specific amidase [Jeotgalibacillus alimentarius]|uniref:Spore cortex-lytic enzyme n=1 Tax=Jeotgalibacillus alimentarius TaxID=135826 RepID=A0A0C2VYC3_9BACL|nr:spore cortex-lytic enzyme [Jeotgalibacillus alimentarius]KIL48953.1 germination-specific amidase [Jeotgalibacillus alimentarius]
MKKQYIATILICLLFLSNSSAANAFSGQVIQKGAYGDDVIELQARLQYIGYYTGQIDGDFGWGTYWALRNFQQDYGMDIDGLAGPETRQKLINASEYNRDFVKGNINKGVKFTHYGGTPLKNQVKDEPSTQKMTLPKGYSEKDIQLMANAVYGEARGEPYEGQVAVAAVILNRIEDEAFPNTASGVIFEPLAFTAVADGQIWLTPNEQAKRAVMDAINGWDPSENALYYFNPVTATSKWIWSRPQIKQIGEHIFCL